MELSLIREEGRVFYFSYPSNDGKVWCIFGAVICFLGYVGIPNLLGQILVLLFGGILSTVGIFMFLWRHNLRIDLQKRHIVRQFGTWPHLKTETRHLTDLQGVVLTSTSSASGMSASYRPFWFVSLSIYGVDRVLSIDETYDKSTAYKKLDMWARKLNVIAIDRTDKG